MAWRLSRRPRGRPPVYYCVDCNSELCRCAEQLKARRIAEADARGLRRKRLKLLRVLAARA